MDFPNEPEWGPEERRKRFLIALAVICAVLGYLWILSAGIYNLFAFEGLPVVILGILSSILTVLDLRIGLAILMFSIGVSPEFSVLGVPNLRIEDFLFPVVLSTWFIRQAVKREPFISSEFLAPLLLGFLASVISSLFNLIYDRLEFQQSLFRHLKFVEYILLFIVVLNVIRRPSDARMLVHLMVLVGALVGCYGIFQMLHGEFKVTGPPGETSNILGAYYILHISLALGLLVSGSRHRLACVLAIAVMLIPLLNTMARASYISIIMPLVVIFVMRRHFAPGFILLFFGIGLFATERLSDRFSSILGVIEGNAPSSFTARLEGWRMFLGDVYRSPLLGHGVGNYGMGAFDSQYVQQIYEVGIIGTLLFVWLIAKVLRASFRLARESDDEVLRGYSIGLLGGTLGFVVHSLAAPTFTAIRTADSFFFCMGVLGAIMAIRGDEAEELPSSLRDPGRVGLMSGIIRPPGLFGRAS